MKTPYGFELFSHLNAADLGSLFQPSIRTAQNLCHVICLSWGAFSSAELALLDGAQAGLGRLPGSIQSGSSSLSLTDIDELERKAILRIKNADFDPRIGEAQQVAIVEAGVRGIQADFKFLRTRVGNAGAQRGDIGICVSSGSKSGGHSR